MAPPASVDGVGDFSGQSRAAGRPGAASEAGTAA